MPTIKRQTVIAAGAVAQPLTGSQYEYLPFDAVVEIALLNGTTGEDVEATAFSGSDVLLENSIIDEKVLTEAVRYPDDYDVQDVAAAGERIGITLRNTGALPATVRTVVRITPL